MKPLMTTKDLYDFLLKRKRLYELYDQNDVEIEIERLHQQTDGKACLLMQRLMISDFEQFTTDQLFKLGFRQWNDKNSWLIPLWLIIYLDRNEPIVCIDGTVMNLKDDTFDADGRGGCIAYYFVFEPIDGDMVE